jgi:hypothetical protein
MTKRGPKCITVDCKKEAKFNYSNELEKMFCEDHAEKNMANFTHRQCRHMELIVDENGNIEYTQCKGRASQSNDGEKTVRFCAKHKMDGMTNTDRRENNRLCKYVDESGIQCESIASFGNIDDKIKHFCAKHKEFDMLDFHNKDCIEDGCGTRPCYNYPDKKGGIYCTQHKLEGMINVVDGKCNGVHENGEVCLKIPTYNFDGLKPKFCYDHKLNGMKNVKHTHCLNDGCDTLISNKTYNGFCLRCFIFLYPEEPITRNYKTKEREVIQYITSEFPELQFTCDKIIAGGISKRRPDMFVDIGTHFIIIEIDENQHSDYDKECENRRIMEISQDVKHKPIVFIRFNPDDYITIEDEKITSCWRINSLGLHSIKPSKTEEWKIRLARLKKYVNYWTNKIPKKMITTKYLYYNEI